VTFVKLTLHYTLTYKLSLQNEIIKYDSLTLSQVQFKNKFKNDYSKKTAVMNTITNFQTAYSGTEILDEYQDIYKKIQQSFKG